MRSAVKCIAKVHGSVVEIVKMLRKCQLGVEPNVCEARTSFYHEIPIHFLHCH
jgi:hypothetical protein